MSRSFRTYRFGCFIGAALLAASLNTSGLTAPASPQAALDRFANTAGYRLTTVKGKVEGSFDTRLDLTLPKRLISSQWSVYFGSVNPLTVVGDSSFDLVHINGDNYKLTPKAGLTLEPGKTYSVTFNGHEPTEFQALPNAYIVVEGLKPVVLTASEARFDPATGLESLPFVAPITDEATVRKAPGDSTQWLTPERAFVQNASRQVTQAKPDIVILPTPVSAKHLKGQPLDLARGIEVKLSGLTSADIKAALDDSKLKQTAGGVPVDITVSNGPPESYHLVAQNGRITITAGDTAGAAYAIASLSQQAAFEQNRLKPIEITDAPRFGFRGMHIDLARNFHSKAFILRTINQMAELKLNRLHLHLGDDEGWRLAIAPLPELTAIGSHRCHDLKEDTCLMPQLGAGPQGSKIVDGYLSRADYIDILKAAQARHIEVIPSFDMPGHSRAAIRSMEARYRRLMAEGKPDAANEFRLQDPADTTVYDSIQHYDDNTLNVCLPSTYHFIETVLDDIRTMHAEAGVPLKIYHIGADETAGAWTHSSACQALVREKGLDPAHMTPYFITQVSQILEKKGIEPAGWSDGMGHVKPEDMPKQVQSNAWGGLFNGGVAEAYSHANRGWDVVLSTPDVLYFDMPWAVDPKERGADWAARNIDLFKIFAFMPENLAANASVMTDIQAHGRTIADTVPLSEGRRITGIQGQLWSESVRSDALTDYMIWPRLFALSERAWHTGAWEPAYVAGRSYSYGDRQVDGQTLLADWQAFNDRLTPRLAALDRDGVFYRLPTPGARVTGGIFEANLPYGDLKIQYRVKGAPWRTYRDATAVTGPVEVRSVAPNGRRYSRIVTVQ